jgi:repressor LexA
MRLCRLPSIGQVQRCIRVLKERGELESDRDGRISLDFRFSGGSVGVPLIGTIACGAPLLAIENYEGVYRWPEELVGSGEHFMLRAKGSSMTGAGIRDGDYLVLRKQPAADYGQIVAALVGDEATIKTYRPKNGKIVLHPENPKFDDIEVEAENFRILGVLVGGFHKFI